MERVPFFTRPLIGNRIWNRKAEQSVKWKSNNKWKDACNKKASLKHYKQKESPKTEDIYDGSWGSELLCQLRTGSYKTNKRERFWNEMGPKCKRCEEEKQEDEIHLLIECSAYREERMRLIYLINEKIGNSITSEDMFSIAVGLKGKHYEIIEEAKKLISKIHIKGK